MPTIADSCDVGWEEEALFRSQRLKTKNEILFGKARAKLHQESLPSFWVDPDPSIVTGKVVRKMEKQREKRRQRRDNSVPDPRDEWKGPYVRPTREKKKENTKGKVVVVQGHNVDPNPDFPYRGAGRFRRKLLEKRMALDTEGSLDAVGRKVCRLFHMQPTDDCPYCYLLPDQPVPEPTRPTVCARSKELRRKARAIVKLLRADQRLKAVHPLPHDFVCGTLRSKIRSMYAQELTVAQELSIKTSMKVEVQPCDYCEDLQKSWVDDWQKGRRQPKETNPVSLEKFKRAFACNVPDGWDRGKERVPYVPNGHATKSYRRSDGGNWQEEEFSDTCRVELVYSSGKPRIVTLYSARNVEVLTPLHKSLYSHLKRKGWLLVGSPTRERLEHLESGCAGSTWLSFDYSAATDNIKLEYVRAMIDVLKQKSVGLTEDEVKCLDVLGSLGLPSTADEETFSGQPMGSPMSFPLLCLINKTVVDLALVDLLETGKISLKEWAGHRLLVNGDDLLTKDTSSGGLVAAVTRAGSETGLVVNQEKTMQSPEYGEINSTVFKNCILQKKTNVSALWMGQDVADVAGFALEATTTGRGLKMVLLANASRLARQKIKTVQRLPRMACEVILSSSLLKKAVCAYPARNAPELTNLFPIVPLPDGYNLSREEEAAVLTREVSRARAEGRWRDLNAEKKRLTFVRKGINALPGEELPGRKIWKLLQPKNKPTRETVLQCFAREWESKRKEALLADDTYDDPSLIVSDLSGIGRITDAIKAWKESRKLAGVSCTKASVLMSTLLCDEGAILEWGGPPPEHYERFGHKDVHDGNVV